jgi:hypothetical protein
LVGEEIVNHARRCCSIAVLALLACVVIAGCAQRERADEENRSGGFYGGVSGGITR